MKQPKMRNESESESELVANFFQYLEEPSQSYSPPKNGSGGDEICNVEEPKIATGRHQSTYGNLPEDDEPLRRISMMVGQENIASFDDQQPSSNKAKQRRNQYISRLFYEEEANDTKPRVDMFAPNLLRKRQIKIGIEGMYQVYSRRQFAAYMTSVLILLGIYKVVILIITASVVGQSADPTREDYLFVKMLLAGSHALGTIVFLIGVNFKVVYEKRSSLISIMFLLLYGIGCLAEPWVEAGFYSSTYDQAPMVLHYIFTAYATLPVGTLTSAVAALTVSILSVATQICIFVYAYEIVLKDAEDAHGRESLAPNYDEPEEGVVNFVITLCLLYTAANVIGVYLKVFCTDLTYRQTFYNTHQFIEAELETSRENEINNRFKEWLIQRILPVHLIEELRDVLQQVETVRPFKANRKRRQSTFSHYSRGGESQLDARSTLINFDPKQSQVSEASALSASKMMKLNIQKHNDVTILFADIVGFVQLTASLTAEQLVETLHDLYYSFDDLANANRCQRTKLIGDCYKCIAGLDVHRHESAFNAVLMGLQMALAIVNVARERNVPQLKMRIGVHSGSVFAGILGLRKWQFDVWSDDVEIANALESEGRPGYVHASWATVSKLPPDIFNIEPVDTLPGKTEKTTDLLTRKQIRTFIVTVLPNIPMPVSQSGKHLFPISPPGSDGPSRNPSNLSEGVRKATDAKTSNHTSDSGTLYLRQKAKKKILPGLPFNGPTPSNSSDQPAGLSIPHSFGRSVSLNLAETPSARENPICEFMTETRQFSQQRRLSPEEKEAEVKRRIAVVYGLENWIQKHSENRPELDRQFLTDDRTQLTEIMSEMNPVALTFKNPRLERIYKQHRDDPFQLAIVVSYLTFLIITAIIRLNALEGTKPAVTTAISSVTTLALGLTVFFFTICGFSNKLMARLRVFLCSNFARSVAFVITMAILYCNIFMPFYLCKELTEEEIKDIFGETTACRLCDFANANCSEAKSFSGENNGTFRAVMRQRYPPIINFEPIMSEPRSERRDAGYCADTYVFGDMTILLVFATAVFSRIPYLIRYLVIVIGNLVFIFFALLLKQHAFTAFDLCAVQHMLDVGDYESKIFYSFFITFFFLNLCFMCYQQEKNNRLDFLLRDAARRQVLEKQRKLMQNTALIENMIPRHVIEWHIDNIGTQGVYIHSHDKVCVLFAKITNYTFEGESVEVMRALNEISAAFDGLLDLPQFNGIIEKIKLNQTMFLYAAGLSVSSDCIDDSALRLAEFAATMFSVLAKLNDRINFDYTLRAALHVGPVVGGVIGKSMPLYDIFGTTVNVASRLESAGQDGYIHVSEEMNAIFEKYGLMARHMFEVVIRGLGDSKKRVYMHIPQEISEFMKELRECFF